MATKQVARVSSQTLEQQAIEAELPDVRPGEETDTGLSPGLERYYKGRRRGVKAMLALRTAGATYEEIAEVLGYRDAEDVQKIIVRELQRQIESDPDSQDQMRQLASRRLERLLQASFKKATDPKHPDHLAATQTVLKILDQHAKMHGYNAPSEHVVHTPSTEGLARWVAAASAHLAGDAEEDDIFSMGVVEGEIVSEVDDAVPTRP